MRSVRVVLASAFSISLSSVALAAHLPFNPREYPKKIVSCPAINRAENTAVDIELRKGTFSWLSWYMERAILIWNTRRLRRNQPQGRKNAAAPARLAESVGQLEISDTRVSGSDWLNLLCATKELTPPLG